MTDQSLIDKSLRSVFVGNIPYEATEEILKDIFSEVGPVLSFKFVYDRDTGKPKGYGFCEYKDQETALSAMRNLNSYEIGGRTLRVDNACTEKSRMEIQNLLQGPVIENPYGEYVDAEKAPEAISKVVTSLPPEQMYELIKQMKECIINNPAEAKQMLIQNPQLTYALLQVLVAMKIVDTETALSMLHSTPQILDSHSKPNTPPLESSKTTPVTLPQPVPPPVPVPVQPPTFSTMDVDLRMQPPVMPMDQSVPPPPLPLPQPQAQPMPARIDRVDPRTGIAPLPKPVPAPTLARPPPAPVQPPVLPPVAAPPVPVNPTPISTNIGGSATDQEKAALIMQVLQLSDEQIAMLPPEQRQSILVLKEQIAKSTQR